MSSQIATLKRLLDQQDNFEKLRNRAYADWSALVISVEEAFGEENPTPIRFVQPCDPEIVIMGQVDRHLLLNDGKPVGKMCGFKYDPCFTFMETARQLTVFLASANLQSIGEFGGEITFVQEVTGEASARETKKKKNKLDA